MTLAEAEAQAPAQTRLSRIVAPFQLIIGTLLLAWPAVYNGFPLLYPDSMTYLDDGRIVARALFLHRLADYYGMRSFFYSLVILPFHWNVTAWPIVLFQCFLVAYVIRLVVRAVAPQAKPGFYIALMLILSVCTSLSWYTCLILPDVLGPVLYLALYLIAFGGERLSRAERTSLYAIAWWGITSHATHLVQAAVLCPLIAIVLALQRNSRTRILRVTRNVIALVAVAAGSQLALHAYLYGHPSLNGERPPFLMARVIADGPGQWYLQKNCSHLNWTICRHLNELSDDPDNLLWAPDGLWQSASEDEQEQMFREEMSLVIGTLREYPQEQFRRSALNFWQQLRLFGLYDLDPSTWVADEFPTVMPASRDAYLRSRQARNALPLEGFTAFQFWIVIASTGVIALALTGLRRSASCELIALLAMIGFIVVLNAATTGVLSMPEDRFQCRVIWLVPFLAILLGSTLLTKQLTVRRGKTSGGVPVASI